MNFKQLDFYKLSILLLFAVFIAVYYQNGNQNNNRYEYLRNFRYGGAIFDKQTGVIYSYGPDYHYKKDLVNNKIVTRSKYDKVKNKN